jgi:hypothetical protein
MDGKMETKNTTPKIHIKRAASELTNSTDMVSEASPPVPPFTPKRPRHEAPSPASLATPQPRDPPSGLATPQSRTQSTPKTSRKSRMSTDPINVSIYELRKQGKSISFPLH